MTTFAIDVDAPPDAVWAVWADVASWPRWNPTVATLTLLDGARTLGPGVRARVKQPQLPASTWAVVTWDPTTHWEWRARNPGVTTTARHELTDLGDGRTRVVGSVHHAGPLATVVGRLTGGLTRQYVEREVTALKHRCEGGADLHGRRPPDGLRH